MRQESTKQQEENILEITMSNESNNISFCGEPDFTATNPPILIPNYVNIIETGSYVTYFSKSRLLHGRILKSFARRGNEMHVRINNYFT